MSVFGFCEGRERIKDVEGLEGLIDEGEAEEEDSCAICADTESALSREIPRVISAWGFSEEGLESASMSISGAGFGLLF